MWRELSILNQPREKEYLIVEVEESDCYKAIVFYQKNEESPHVAGTFEFMNGTGIHLYQNDTSVIKHYCYLDTLVRDHVKFIPPIPSLY